MFSSSSTATRTRSDVRPAAQTRGGIFLARGAEDAPISWRQGFASAPGALCEQERRPPFGVAADRGAGLPRVAQAKKVLTNRICCGIIYGYMIFAPLAQPVEHLTFNQGVRSSNLRWSTRKRRLPRQSSFSMKFVPDGMGDNEISCFIHQPEMHILRLCEAKLTNNLLFINSVANMII